MSSTKPSIPKGTRDFGPEESAKRNYIIEIIRRNFIKYGFSQIETPAMEQLSVLTGKYGDEGDQLLFKILNSGDYLKATTAEDYGKGSQHMLNLIAEKGLRYDLTVPFARFVVQNRHLITFPFKRFQIQPVWRADKPQKGRYREFYQCDADIIGTESLWNEAELTLLIHDIFSDLNYRGFVLKVNHRAILNSLAGYVGLEGKEMPFCITIDKLDKIGKEKVREELVALGADAEKLETVLTIFESEEDHEARLASIIQIAGDAKGPEELKKYFAYLEPFRHKNLRIELDFSLARGLTYYTGMIFEVKPTDVKIGSISGGGRYDNLTAVFGLEGVSGVGISFGLDRIYDVLSELSLFPENLSSTADLLITHFDEACFTHGLELLSRLREAGINAIIYPEITKIKKQFNYADKLNINKVLVVGAEEITQKRYSLKDMKTSEQVSMTLDELIILLKLH